jgi:hypothetical protein
MNKSKVDFGDPDAGCVLLAIEHRNDTLEIPASHGFDIFRPLTLALHSILKEQGEGTVTLLGEPEQITILKVLR